MAHSFKGLRLGAHESIGGGLSKAIDRGVEHGAEAVQIFTKSARGWAAKPLAEADALAYRAAAGKSGLPSAAHASYLVNLAAEPGDLREKSLDSMADDWSRAHRLGLVGLVVHPGSHPDPLRGTTLVAEALAELHRRVPKGESKLLLENTAGQGTALGFRLDGLGALVMAADHLGAWAKKRVGVCLDTCHLFAGGYDLSTREGYEATIHEVDERIGLERVYAFHLNDSKGPLGCRLDRHENIGQGHLGTKGFEALVNDRRFAGVPGFLETEDGEQVGNLKTLKALRS
jgi:deoxyribonuclease-4